MSDTNNLPDCEGCRANIYGWASTTPPPAHTCGAESKSMSADKITLSVTGIAELVGEIKRLREENAHIAEQEQERCCKAVCERCRNTQTWNPAELYGNRWYHFRVGLADGIGPCYARPIRNLPKEQVKHGD